MGLQQFIKKKLVKNSTVSDSTIISTMHQPGITVIFYVSHHAQNSRVQSNFVACEEEDRKQNKKNLKPFKPQTILVHAFQ